MELDQIIYWKIKTRLGRINSILGGVFFNYNNK